MAGPDDENDEEKAPDRDTPLAIPLEFEEALKGLLAVDPDDDEKDSEN